MRKVELKDMAGALASMACSEGRLSDDLETLAKLPDELITLDLLASTANHPVAGTVDLRATHKLARWFLDRLTQCGFRPNQIREAKVLLDMDTRSRPTHRATLIWFWFEAEGSIVVDGRSFTAKAKRDFWYNRSRPTPLVTS